MYTIRRVGLIVLVLILGVVFFSGGMAFANGDWIFNGPIYNLVLYDINSSWLIDDTTVKVPDFADLGVNTVYLQPVFDHTGRSSPYSVVDYYRIDSRHGTWTDLQELVTAVHNNNMKIIGDLIVSYTPVKNWPWQPQSWIYLNHQEWILHDPQTNKLLKTYPTAWGWALDHIHTGLISYLTDVAKYHVQNYNFDGWRIDAPQRNYDPAKFPTPRYATDMLRSIKDGIISINPNAAMYTEWSGPLVPWDNTTDPLFDEMAEMSYDWELRSWMVGSSGKAITNSGGTSAEFVNLINNQVVWYGRGRSRFLENHDTDRLAYLLQNAGRVNSNDPLITLISTLPGAPMIRSGQEVREVNASGQVNWPGDTTLRAFYKKVFAVRKAHPVLNSGTGTLTDIWTSGANAITYARAASGQPLVGDNGVIVLLNAFYANAPNAITFTVSIPGLEPGQTYQLYELLTDTVLGTATGSQLGNNYTINLPAYGKQVIKLIPVP